MSNPFDLLGNDVEDVNDVQQQVPREVVKKNTSSKKADVPPPSANKDKARKPRPQATGNEAAFKDKSAGRSANKSKAVEEPKATKGKPSKGAKTDRQPRSAKTDSEKKIKQAGWTADAEDELEAEVEGAEDAQAELKEEENKVKKLSLEEYLKEAAASNKVTTREARKVEAVADEDIIVKEEEEFIAQSKGKKEKSKALKTKQFLDFSATFADNSAPAPRADRESSAPRGGRAPRGGKSTRGDKTPRGGKAPRAAKAPKADGPKLTEENFPSLG